MLDGGGSRGYYWGFSPPLVVWNALCHTSYYLLIVINCVPCCLSSAHTHFAYDDLVGPYRNFRESCKRAHTFWACKQAILIELVLGLLYAHAQNVIARLQGSLKFYKMDYIVWCCRPFAERKGLVRGGWSRYWIITWTHIPDDVSTYSFACT